MRDEKLKVIRALLPIDGRNAGGVTVRGQYRAGNIGGASVPSYLSEIDNGDSATETFVAIKAEIGNWRWAGVPFYLRTGKRLAARVSEIVVAFKRIPHSIFDTSVGDVHPNQLVIRLQPDEGVKLWLMIKDPGPGGMRLVYVPLDMSFAQAFKVRSPDAYERLILDVIRGNQTLFMRRDEVEAAWQWIDPILHAWGSASEPPKPYAAGTWGPSASFSLLGDRTWHDLVDVARSAAAGGGGRATARRSRCRPKRGRGTRRAAPHWRGRLRHNRRYRGRRRRPPPRSARWRRPATASARRARGSGSSRTTVPSPFSAMALRIAPSSPARA